jgi:peptidoglycan/LPS O-acetylase OafA/YrhL
MSATTSAADDGTVWPVEAWRGLAAWMVVYSHYWASADSSWQVLRFTFTGVDLFFVLSGFVFAPYFFDRPLRAGAFAVRRFFRIYPAYLLALLIYFCLKLQAGQPLAYVWQHLVFAYLQSREMAFYYNPVFWSLPSEVEFYLLLPLLAWFCRGRLMNFVALALGALVMRVLIGYASDAATQNSAYLWMHHLPGMLLEFLLGAGAWWLSQRGLQARVRALLLAGGVTLWLLLAGFFAQAGDAGINASWARGQMGWLAALSFACIVAASMGRANPLKSAPPALVWAALWAGRLSYGSYLFHIAALRLLQPYGKFLGAIDVTLAAALLTLFVAWLSYRLWENPWRGFGRSLARRLA